MSSSKKRFDRRKAASILTEKELFDKALRLNKLGRTADAIEILEGFVERYPDLATPAGVLGSIYHQLRRYSEAIPYLEKATNLSPHSELASRALFHSFLNLERKEEAILELERFIALTGSEEFRAIRRELREKE